jgi:hypothetical protein
MHPTPYITQEGIPMAIAEKHSNPDGDFIKVGPDATATFDNSASNPTEHASSENLDAAETEDDDLKDEDEDEDEDEEDEEDDDEDDEDEEEEEEEEDDEEDDEVVEDDDDEEEEDEEEEEEDEEEDDHDLATGPKAPSVYRKA